MTNYLLGRMEKATGIVTFLGSNAQKWYNIWQDSDDEFEYTPEIAQTWLRNITDKSWDREWIKEWYPDHEQYIYFLVESTEEFWSQFPEED
jgi:hypothetical protein